jgi:hypothetical protein
VSSASGAAGSSHTEGKAAKGSGERGGSRESFKSAALKLFTEGSEGNKDLQFLSFTDLRYLRFLLLNSSPLAQTGRKKRFSTEGNEANDDWSFRDPTAKRRWFRFLLLC